MADADMLKKMQDECKCSYCNGVGTVTHSENVFQDGLGCYEWVTTKETCTDCKGTGVSKNISCRYLSPKTVLVRMMIR